MSRSIDSDVAVAASILRECATGLREALARAEHVTAVLTGPTVDRSVALTNAHDYLTNARRRRSRARRPLYSR